MLLGYPDGKRNRPLAAMIAARETSSYFVIESILTYRKIALIIIELSGDVLWLSIEFELGNVSMS